MARSTTETSVRQQAFAVLDNMIGASRKEAAQALMTKFNIGQPYAMTIYQQHRNSLKASGKLVATFAVRDTDKGPSIVTTHVTKPGKTDAKTPEAAVKQYVAGLQSKIDAAGKLDTTIPEPAPKEETKKTSTKKTSDKSDKTEGVTTAEAADTEATA